MKDKVVGWVGWKKERDEGLEKFDKGTEKGERWGVNE